MYYKINVFNLVYMGMLLLRRKVIGENPSFIPHCEGPTELNRKKYKAYSINFSSCVRLHTSVINNK